MSNKASLFRMHKWSSTHPDRPKRPQRAIRPADQQPLRCNECTMLCWDARMGKTTTREEWRARLQGLAEVGGEVSVSTAAEEMRDNVIAPGRAIGDCLDAPGSLKFTARFILLELGPASLEGLLSTPPLLEAEDRAWLIERLLECELQTRARTGALDGVVGRQGTPTRSTRRTIHGKLSTTESSL